MATGTITQSLPTLTQSATGEASYYTIIATAQVSEIYTQILNASEVHTAIAGDSTTAVEHETVVGTANASNVLSFQAGPTVHETATGTQHFISQQTTTFSPSSFAARDSVRFVRQLTLTDTANASNVLDAPITAALHTTAYLSSTATPTVQYFEELLGTASASNLIIFDASVLYTDTADASGTIHALTTTAYETLTSTATAVASTTWLEALIASLTATATATNTLDDAGSTYVNLLSATATAEGTLWARDYGALAWTLNTETGAATSYTNFEFSSLAFYDGVLYGTAPDGLFVLSGEDDNGRAITADTQTGFVDFKTSRHKRISDIYLGYTGGALECSVEAYGATDEIYSYTLEERTADTPRNNRFKVGRGLKSRYWRVRVQNVAGADFQIYDVTAVAGTSGRRL